MNLVYRYNNYVNNDILFDLCKISKDLYNQALYHYLLAINTRKEKYFNYFDLDKLLKITPNINGEINYRKLKAQVSQQILKLVDKAINNYFKNLNKWKLNQNKYNGKPRLPKYLPKNGFFLLIYPKQSCAIKNGIIYLSKHLTIPIPQWDKVKNKLSNFQQIRILPKNGYTTIEIVYNDITTKSSNLDYNRYASIDLGINNLVTLVTDFSNPLLYNGKQIKSKNQWYNKEISKLKHEAIKCNNKHTTKKINNLYVNRYNEINDLLHKISRHIVNLLNNNGVGCLVCGRNKGWKDSINLGKVTNQNFIQIPYDTLINMLKYKCEMCGINFIETEENYTSRCDALVNEEICKHDFYKGKRIKRGLFQSESNNLINADVNGALNIMRKVVGDSEYITRIINSGWLFQPKKLNDLYCLNS